jgi:hypothetical protein
MELGVQHRARTKASSILLTAELCDLYAENWLKASSNNNGENKTDFPWPRTSWNDPASTWWYGSRTEGEGRVWCGLIGLARFCLQGRGGQDATESDSTCPAG